MTIQLVTHRDALRHTAKRVLVAVSLAVTLTFALAIVQFGPDPNAVFRAEFVTASMLGISVVVTVLLTAILSYRSALVMQDLTLTRAELWRISRTDPLTGLLNRRGFDEAAMVALAEAQKKGLSAVAMMCDIDQFKSINDKFGHEFGDKVLVAVAEVLKDFAHETGHLVARHGGEEFSALMIGVTNAEAMQWAEAIVKTCEINEIVSEGISARVTISIGLTLALDEANLSEIMRIADQALYVAKDSGRNRAARVASLSAFRTDRRGLRLAGNV